MGRAQTRLNEGDNARKRVALGDRLKELQDLAGGLVLQPGQLANGTTAGKAKSVAAIYYTCCGASAGNGAITYRKAATDDLWDCTGFTPDVTDGAFGGAIFCLDEAGTATTYIVTEAASLALLKVNAIAVAKAKFLLGETCVGWWSCNPSGSTHAWATEALNLNSGDFYEFPPVISNDITELADYNLA